MIIERKLYSYQNARFKSVSEDEEEDDVFSRRPLYCGCTGSDVIGCRRPTSGVFIYVFMLQAQVTLTAFPIATPRGRSSKITSVVWSTSRLSTRAVTFHALHVTLGKYHQETRGELSLLC